MRLFLTNKMLEIRYNSNMLNEVATDEVGRGCLAGPVVAAAVILPLDYVNKDIKDSKKIAKSKHRAIYNDIIKNAICYSIQEASVQEIEDINILQAAQLAMRRSILALPNTAEHIIIDGNYWKDELKIPYTTIVKGDGKYLGIAAASILAKVYRDELMQKLHDEFPMYDWSKNAGYATKKHKDAIAKHGITAHHRASFIHI
jgi:ribonuclease HII